MKREKSLRETAGDLLRSRGGYEDVVVRPMDGKRDQFEIAALVSQKELYVPLEAPIYTGDRIERRDPRNQMGAVIEYVVTDVTMNKDPFGHGNDYSVVTVHEAGHVERSYGATHIHVTGGTNQFAVNSDNAILVQTPLDSGSEIVALLKQLRAEAPLDQLASVDREDLEGAIEDAIGVAQEPSSSPSRLRRALLAVRGVIEPIALKAATSATDVAAREWSTAASKKVLEVVSALV